MTSDLRDKAVYKRHCVAALVILLLTTAAATIAINSAMNSKIERLCGLNDDFELCDQVFVAIGDRYKHWISADKYRPVERVVMLVWHATGIIGNGGFEYLFSDDFDGDPGFRLTLAAFEEADCPEAAAALREALAQFPNGQLPTDLNERTTFYESVPAATRDALNVAFWKMDWERVGAVRIRHKLAKYIRDHKSAFADL